MKEIVKQVKQYIYLNVVFDFFLSEFVSRHLAGYFGTICSWFTTQTAEIHNVHLRPYCALANISTCYTGKIREAFKRKKEKICDIFHC